MPLYIFEQTEDWEQSRYASFKKVFFKKKKTHVKIGRETFQPIILLFCKLKG